MKRFSNTAIFLHWCVAGLIVSQFVLAKLAENARHHDKILEQLALLANHKSLGITILVLALIRLAYRLATPTLAPPTTMSRWQISASKVSHVLLYGFLFALPLSGWLMSSAKAYSVSWFNLVALPDAVAPNKGLAEFLQTSHYYLAEALFVIALIHILAAIKHHFIDKDDVLKRMSGTLSWALFILVIILALSFLGRIFNSPPETATITQTTTSIQKPLTSIKEPQSSLPMWQIDYEQSFIKFVGDQAGAPFEGEWKSWSAEIQFDAAQLDQARFNVSIDLSSGFSNNQERDDTIRSADFFDVASFPKAVYRASNFSDNSGSFQSFGELSMKGVGVETPMNFQVELTDGIKVLSGSASLNRFDWNIGSGDWTDTSWVGENVQVKVRVVTKSKTAEP